MKVVYFVLGFEVAYNISLYMTGYYEFKSCTFVSLFI